ncbi:RagB/SusD family nutrient uptake outer membrane protein [Niastella caeni]|uniref:RagB/SusD family nutrient uptake outer membrane protein n=1 Tax=Niastella caeni TaxID=2569763 RepID=A0A4S8HI13_9BACT|nr:RagB/SusD family nutrient uptake outer membrane protein [Niastella caeni]THU34737.1 RagB/SusD family nutrient uptake outer membrane protein [Niastella caeni]
MQSIYKTTDKKSSLYSGDHFLSRFYIFSIATVLILVFESGCKKLVDVDPPDTTITGSSVYASDATAIAVLTGIYTRLSSTANYDGNTGFTTISLFTALSADEMALFDLNNANYLSFYRNSLSASGAGSEFWPTIYSYIFTCNSAIEGLKKSTTLAPAVKQQLTGEAKFMRAFFYFYLINLYGDVPLVLNIDYKVNSLLSRIPKAQVYQQIINDLKEAQDLLTSDYVKGDVISKTTERVRPNKWAATALLARAYLFNGDYINAESQATSVINNSSMYSLSTLPDVFLKNSNEAILQLQPVFPATVVSNTHDAVQFIIPATGPSNSWPVYLSTSLVNSFESSDQRKINWVSSVIMGTDTFYYPYKYKMNTPNDPVTEYLMLLRLAEQYFIRAESRAKQNKLNEAMNDLNVIRTRAGLANTTATTQSELIIAIQHERQVELFMELGHRWLDLKRMNVIDAVMTIVTPKKGGTWSTNWQLYPIPVGDIQKDPNLIQNAGY